jgi:hypothetical protein
MFLQVAQMAGPYMRDNGAAQEKRRYVVKTRMLDAHTRRIGAATSMKQFSRSLLLWILSFASACAAATAPLSPEFQPLDKAVGKWIYHGENLQTAYTKAGKWTWEVDCGWSANRIYLVCSFAMDWPEGPDHSVSISTYNRLDKGYWHYEVIDDYRGNKPVVSRMTVDGDTWTDASDNVDANGKTASHYRVIYRYASSTRVEVKFEISKDATHWTTLGEGEGIKQQ